MRLTSALLVAGALALAGGVPVAGAGERVALVIGNARYEQVPALRNAGHDATDVGRAFARLGYAVTRMADADHETLRRGLQQFARTAAAAEIAVVYYAGHGMEVDGRNYLVPVDARLSSGGDVEFETIALDLVMRAVSGSGAFRLVILDACRNNPFAAGMRRAGETRALGRGLARVEPAGETLVAYAAKDGTVAGDGEGRNSPYTGALLEVLEEPGLEVGLMFRKVRDAVLAATGGRQEPFVYGSLSSRGVYLDSGRTVALTVGEQKASAPAAVSEGGAGDVEALFWESVDRDDAAELEVYLREYPEGKFAALARARLARLEGAEADDAAFGRAKAAGTAAAYGEYLTAYPAGRHAEEAVRLRAAKVAAEQAAEQAAGRLRRLREPGTVFRDCAECPEMVTVPAGIFTMGSPAHEAGRDQREGPQHLVRIAEPLAVGKYEVTREEFARFVWDTGRSMEDSCWLVPDFRQTDRHPVGCVSWRDAQAYVEWLSRKTGERYRLLSESEWEYAARGGTNTARYWGESAALQCRHANGRDVSTEWTGVECDDGYAHTAPVGSFTKNQYGLYDMLGNVSEWTQDCWNDSYAGAPTDGSAWEQRDCHRWVIRGGAFRNSLRALRSAFRWAATFHDDAIGFRVARSLTS